MVKKLNRRIFILLFSLINIPVYAANVTDDTSVHVTLAQPAKRIISLAPDITEIIFAIGAGDRLVGVIGGSDFPQAAKSITQVGTYSGLDIEKIIELHPDLVVAWSQSFTRQLILLKKLRIPVYMTEPHRLEDIPKTMKALGCLAGVENQAQVAAHQFNQQLTQLKAHYHLAKPISVFYQIGGYGLMTINKDSWINQIISLCGGRNIFADAKTIAPEVNWEAIVAANPTVVIAGTENTGWRERWAKWPTILAVKQQQLFAINPDLVERAGPRILEGATTICAYLDRGRGQAVH